MYQRKRLRLVSASKVPVTLEELAKLEEELEYVRKRLPKELAKLSERLDRKRRLDRESDQMVLLMLQQQITF